MLYADNDSEFEKMINAISKIWSLNFTVLQPLVLNVVTLESLLPSLSVAFVKAHCRDGRPFQSNGKGCAKVVLAS